MRAAMRTPGIALVVLLWLTLGVASPAGAQGGERIRLYDVRLEIDASGDLLVTETIRYDFGGNERRGIFRDLVVRVHFDGTHDRLYPLQVLGVSTSAGTPDRYQVEDIEGGRTRIRIGDPNRTISGEHSYEIRYRVRGALNGFAEHDELYWNVIGGDWDAPIERASIRVMAPAEVTRVACFAGPTGSNLPCEAAGSSGATAMFTQTNLRARHGVTVVVAMPTGVVPAPEPILAERWSLRRAFAVTPLTVAGSALVFAAAAAAVGRLAWLGGRDRRWAGSAVDVAFGSPDGETERVGWFGRPLYPLEYVPPDGLRPGEIGVLVDEIAHPVDVTATIVDLGVRGYLRIEEVGGERQGLLRWASKPDWRFVRLRRGDEGELARYERVLLDGLFQSGDEVLLSSLDTTFVQRLRRVQDALYEAVVEHGWFPRSPKATRERWLALGFAVLILGGLVQVGATALTHLALVPIALPLAGVALIATHTTMPHRTARGTAALVRVRGFRRFIESAEQERARFAEQANLFYEYLPYAIVFGAADRWAQAFAGLEQQPANPDWYRSSQPFSVRPFAASMNAFAVTSAGTIASTPGGSGSSGFSGGSSGGGGGGGGGGSW